MKQKFRVGDRVYPIDYDSLNELKVNKVGIKNFVGVVTEANHKHWGKWGYAVDWMDKECINPVSVLKCAWWEDDELTDNHNEFFKEYNEHELPDYLDEDFDEDGE